MSEQQKRTEQLANLPATVQVTRGHLQAPGAQLQAIASELTEEQRQALSARIVESQISLVESAQQSDQQHHDAARGLDEFVDKVARLEQHTSGEIYASTQTKTASGRIDIRVKKGSNQPVVLALIAAAALVAISLFMALSR